MHPTKPNGRGSNLPRKSYYPKKESLFDLINQIPGDKFSSYKPFEHYVDFVEKTIPIIEKIEPEFLTNNSFSKHESIVDLAKRLEDIVYNFPFDLKEETLLDEESMEKGIGVTENGLKVYKALITPSYIYFIFLDRIYQYPEEMRIGYAHFLCNYMKFSPYGDVFNDNFDVFSFFRELEMEAESYETDEKYDNEESRENEDDEGSLIRELKIDIEENPEYKKILKDLRRYRDKDYQIFLKYTPKTKKEKSIKESLEFAYKFCADDFFFNNYSFSTKGTDEGCCLAEEMFLIFPKEDDNQQSEHDCNPYKYDNGCCPLMVAMDFIDGKPDKKGLKKRIKDFDIFENHLVKICNYGVENNR